MVEQFVDSMIYHYHIIHELMIRLICQRPGSVFSLLLVALISAFFVGVVKKKQFTDLQYVNALSLRERCMKGHIG